MFTDRFRGRPGVLGWLVLKWDVWVLRFIVRHMVRRWKRGEPIKGWPHRHS